MRDAATNAIEALAQGQIDVLIFDAYLMSDGVVEDAATAGVTAVFRDGRPYGPEAITIDPNPGASDAAGVLSGPTYMPLARPFAALHDEARHYEYSKADPVNVLVAFGARDGADITSAVLDEMNKLSRPPRTKVVLASSSVHAKTVAAKVAEFSWVEILEAQHDIDALLGGFDLAIGAPGVSQFERACCGLPTILVPQNEKQKPLAGDWANSGAAICSSVAPGAIASALISLLGNPSRIAEIRQRCLSMVDGRGAARLSEALKQRAVR